jgi:hypothetical protein
MYRMQVYMNGRRDALADPQSRGTARNDTIREQAVPVAVLSGDPAYAFAATALCRMVWMGFRRFAR